ncbi:MAG: YbaB/EbfC family nucleoid-associated protein [Clostridia bacterium]|nr:YbaB/EbfC family nucleoid-associated protein [Clostridia bacterium]
MARHGGFPGMGMGNMQQLQRQMQKLQQQMADTQEQLEARSYEATSGGGMVTATVSGKKQLVSLTVKPEAVDPEDVEMLQDMIVAAVNQAMQAADTQASSNMQKLTGGMSLPF